MGVLVLIFFESTIDLPLMSFSHVLGAIDSSYFSGKETSKKKGAGEKVEIL